MLAAGKMSMYTRFYIFCVVGGIGVLAIGTLSAGSRNEQTEDLLKLLGSDHYEERERATRALITRSEAVPSLLKLRGAADTEIARRVNFILNEMEKRRLAKQIAFLTIPSKKGEVDQLVENFVHRIPHADEKECWQVIYELTERLLDFEKRTYNKSLLTKWGEIGSRKTPQRLLRFAKVITAARITSRELDPEPSRFLYLIRTKHLDVRYLRGAALSSGPAIATDLAISDLYCADSVKITGSEKSVIVCDGDFTAWDLAKSLVIARGAVKLYGATNSTVLSGSSIEITYAHQSALVCAGKVLLKKPSTIRDTMVRENVRDALGPVKFFDLSAAGLDAELADGALRVKRVVAGTPFSRAGLHAGDLILAVDGTPVAGYEPFRRLLRRKIVLDEAATFRVRRAGRTLDLRFAGKK